MPTFTFNDSDNQARLVDPGEYFAEVVGYEFGYARSGNETLTLVLKQEPDGALVFDTLVFTQKAFWKIDTMLKCFLPSKGVGKLDKGKTFDINEDFCEKHLLNARGPVKLMVDEYPKDSGKLKNKVETYNVPETKPEVGSSPKYELVESAQSSPVQPPVQPQPAPVTTVNDVDVPF